MSSIAQREHDNFEWHLVCRTREEDHWISTSPITRHRKRSVLCPVRMVFDAEIWRRREEHPARRLWLGKTVNGLTVGDLLRDRGEEIVQITPRLR
jgi:hypothetical protein